MATGSGITKCERCGKRNRVKTGGAGTPVCGNCGTALKFVSKPIVVTDANFSEIVMNTRLPVLLDLWAEWCAPCGTLAPIIDELAEEFAGRVIVGKVDIDKNQITASNFGVRSIPTLLVLKKGIEIERIVGLQTKDAISEKLLRCV